MIEKVNPSHPDKVADRIAGALVDLAYRKEDNPKVAVEVLVGHGKCHIIAETSVHFETKEVADIVRRIMDTDNIFLDYQEVPQDPILASNQDGELRCGDNGIFKGIPVSHEEEALSGFVRALYTELPSDGKFILDEGTRTFIACQSNTNGLDLASIIEWKIHGLLKVVVNPLGEWTGGTNVDTGATNRKLGSDMGRAVTGGGLHGKDLSKADVAVNIYAHLLAQESGKEVNLCCAIGDDNIAGTPYSVVVEIARDYINKLGGFEKLAEWGLV